MSKIETAVNAASDSNKTWLSRFTSAFLDGWRTSSVLVIQDTTSKSGLQKMEVIAMRRDSINNAKTDSLFRLTSQTNNELTHIKTVVNRFPTFDTDSTGALEITLSTRVDTVTRVKKFKFNNDVGTGLRDTNR